MPSHKTHRKIDRLLLGKEHEDVHLWLDEPVKYLGPHHRILRHSFVEIANKYANDPERFLSAYFHLVADFSDSEMKRRARKTQKKPHRRRKKK